MTSALSKITGPLFIGSVSYIFCRAFDQPRPLEKAVSVTILMGLKSLAAQVVVSTLNDKKCQKSLTHLLISSTNVLTIPCALFIARRLNFKAPDYLQVLGLSALGYNIIIILTNFVSMLPTQKSS